MDAKSGSGICLFKDTGKIVYGERFVGREVELRQLYQAAVSTRANIAIVGMPRVGKSSLAWQCFMTRKGSLKDIYGNTLIPIYIDCSTLSSKSCFFSSLIKKVEKEVDRLDRTTNGMIPKDSLYYKDIEILKECLTSTDFMGFNNNLLALFEDLWYFHKIGFVIILDEFDHVGNYFDKSDFLLLREVAYTPETSVSYVTSSRKSIKEIEAKDADISNFHGTFSKYIYLNPFTPKDLESYWSRLKAGGVEFTEKEKGDIAYIAGTHPIFLDICCEFLLTNPQEDILDNASLREKLYDEFDQVLEMVERKGVLNELQQIIIGPVYNVTQQDVDRLAAFGFLKQTTLGYKEQLLSLAIGDSNPDDKCYILFSDYFTRLFYAKYFFDTEYWPLWSRTENKLREIVEYFLINRYGDDWEEALEESNENDSSWMSSWNKMKTRYESSQNAYANTRASSIITYTETGELYYSFIKKYFNFWFSRVFTDITANESASLQSMQGNNYNKWNTVFQTLIKIRRPYAHNNAQVLNKADELVAKSYCELILNKIQIWEDNGRSRPTRAC